MGKTSQVVHFKMFKGAVKSWKALFAEAAAFATTLGRDRVINISHDGTDSVVVVWYWAEAGEGGGLALSEE